MKRKWIGIMAALALVAAAPVQVQAEEFSGGDDWNVTSVSYTHLFSRSNL